MFLIDVLGWLGTAGVLAAFALATKTGMTVKVQTINMVAAGCLLTNAVWIGAWSFMALNFAWLVIAWVGLLTKLGG